MEHYANPLPELRRILTQRNMLTLMFWLNTAVFLLVNFINLILWLFQHPQTIGSSGISFTSWWFGVPAFFPHLIERPWSIITYMFVQENFFHLFFNLLMLIFGGHLFMHFLGNRRLLYTYLAGGIWGALFFIGSYNFFPVFSDSLPYAIAIGSSASVLSVLIAVSTFKPNHIVNLFLFGRVKLKYLALIFVIIDIMSIQQSNAGGHIAHLGGAFWGFVYAKLLMNNLLTPYGVFRKRPGSWFSLRPGRKKKPAYGRIYNEGRPLNDDQYNEIRAERQAKIDSILDKISRSGYDALSKEEKEMLFRSGRKD